MDWLNLFGLIIVVLLLIPNLIYFYLTRNDKDKQNKCTNKFMNWVERIGRLACMLFIIVYIGSGELGFSSNESFALWMIMTGILIVVYWSCWGIYYKYRRYLTAMMLAIIPCVIFFSSGLSMGNYPLVASSIVFAIGHIYVTHINERDN